MRIVQLQKKVHTHVEVTLKFSSQYTKVQSVVVCNTLPVVFQSLHAATHSPEHLLQLFSVSCAGSGPMGLGSAGQQQFLTPGPSGAAITHPLVVCSTLPAVSQSLHAATHATEHLVLPYHILLLCAALCQLSLNQSVVVCNTLPVVFQSLHAATQLLNH